MTLSMCVLGSGSSGNCTLVRLPMPGGSVRHLLIDAGLSPRQTALRLGQVGVSLEDLDEVILTHVDHDHFQRSWIGKSVEQGIRWRIHRRHLRAAIRDGLPVSSVEVFDDAFDIDSVARIETIDLPHDRLGSIGFVVAAGGVRLGFATDFGRVTRGLLERFQRLDALAIESNYDPGLQRASGRPAVLRRRIMGGLGHLSNQQTLEAIREVVRTSDLQHLVLLHLSTQCNDPAMLRSLYEREAPRLASRLVISSAVEPTPMLSIEPRPHPHVTGGRQLSFVEFRPDAGTAASSPA